MAGSSSSSGGGLSDSLLQKTTSKIIKTRRAFNSDAGKTNKPFARRSDAIAYGTPYQKAAALVDL
nr:two pore calcium channel protein 1 isoform X1 [Tanacetum cinerariifolium]